MIFISHRGNIDGPNKDKENTINYIEEALTKGYDVEIDVWFVNTFINGFFIGHDQPYQKVDILFLKREGLWIHAKNIEALYELKNYKNPVFFHNQDDAVLTSNGYIWTFSGKQPLTDLSIAVMPGEHYGLNDLSRCYGICSDNIDLYRRYYA